MGQWVCFRWAGFERVTDVGKRCPWPPWSSLPRICQLKRLCEHRGRWPRSHAESFSQASQDWLNVYFHPQPHIILISLLRYLAIQITKYLEWSLKKIFFPRWSIFPSRKKNKKRGGKKPDEHTDKCVWQRALVIPLNVSEKLCKPSGFCKIVIKRATGVVGGGPRSASHQMGDLEQVLSPLSFSFLLSRLEKWGLSTVWLRRSGQIRDPLSPPGVVKWMSPFPF